MMFQDCVPVIGLTSPESMMRQTRVVLKSRSARVVQAGLHFCTEGTCEAQLGRNGTLRGGDTEARGKAAANRGGAAANRQCSGGEAHGSIPRTGKQQQHTGRRKERVRGCGAWGPPEFGEEERTVANVPTKRADVVKHDRIWSKAAAERVARWSARGQACGSSALLGN